MTTKKKHKAGKHLTDLKELPPVSNEGAAKHKNEDPKSHPKERASGDKTEETKSVDVKKETKENEEPKNNEDSKDEKKTNTVLGDGGSPKTQRLFTSKDIILGVINLISIVLLFVLVFDFPKKARELNNLKQENIKNELSVNYEFSNVESKREETKALQSLFLDESGLVNFIDEIEKLKNEKGVITNITFASQGVVQDKTGNFGIPLVIDIKGTWVEIGQALEDIQKLEFLLRAASVDAKPTVEQENVIQFRYGGFLYVEDRMGKD